MKAKDFIAKALDIANNYNTLYVLGCFGAPLNEKNKNRYTNNNEYNGKPKETITYDYNGNKHFTTYRTAEGEARRKMILSATDDTFGFDCVCLIKGILWGWNGDKTKTYGGATYLANGIPDVGANTMINRYCKNVSSDFSKIKDGEAVWIDGHIGIYVGNGQVVECTPKWENKVQITNLGNVGKKVGNYRNWSKHGEIPWVEYDEQFTPYVAKEEEKGTVGTRTYKVVKGDTLTKIASRYGTTVDKIVKDNLKSHKSITKDHIVVGWLLKV